MTTSAEIRLAAGLDGLHARIARRFRRAEARERVKRYLAGLLDRVERKNGWQLADTWRGGATGGAAAAERRRLGRRRVRDDLRSYVSEHLGDPAGVLIVDETGFLKKGTKSVGQRQYSGTAGRLRLRSGLPGLRQRTGGFLDRELFCHRHGCGTPRGAARRGCRRGFLRHQPELAAMLARAFAAGVPAAWVSG